jgi:hypothetical protein
MIFMLGMALVFGTYYVWSGLQGFINSGGLPILESTEQAIEVATTTAEQIIEQRVVMTPFPTSTPLPECQDFIVNVPSAVVRERPSTASLAVDSLKFGEIVCVIERDSENSDWYRIDLNRVTRRIEDAYMHFDIIEALNPTATPTLTFTPAPTVTPMPTATRTRTPAPEPTHTPNPNASATPSLTPPPTPTTALQSA